MNKPHEKMSAEIETPVVQTNSHSEPLKQKREQLKDEQIKSLNEPRNLHFLEVPPVDYERLTLTLVEKGENENTWVYFDMSELIEFEKEVRQANELDVDNGNLELDAPFCWQFMKSFEVAVSTNNHRYGISTKSSIAGFQKFILYGYTRGLVDLWGLDKKPEIWISYKKWVSEILAGGLTANTVAIKYLAFLKIPINAGKLVYKYNRTIQESSVKNLKAALDHEVDFVDRSNLYRKLRSEARHLVAMQLDDWAYVIHISRGGAADPERFSASPTAKSSFWAYLENYKKRQPEKLVSIFNTASGIVLKDIIKSDFRALRLRSRRELKRALRSSKIEIKFYQNALRDSLISDKKELESIYKKKISDELARLKRGSPPLLKCFDSIESILEARDTEHPVAKLLLYIRITASLDDFEKGVESEPIFPASHAYDILITEGKTARITTDDCLITFANFLREHGHTHSQIIKSFPAYKRQTIANGRKNFYPCNNHLAPIFIYINLATGWNLDTIQQISFNLDECLSVADETEHSRTYRLKSRKNRAESKEQTAYIQVSKHKESTSINIPSILKKYRDYLLFINELAPVPGLGEHNNGLLSFFPHVGERNKIGSYAGGNSKVQAVSSQFSDSLRENTSLKLFKDCTYSLTEGRHLYAEHLFELHNRDINVVKAGLSHNSYLLTYLQNHIYVRQGQMEVVDFQSVILKFLSQKRKVDPTTLTIGYRVKDEDEQISLIQSLENYRASHGLNCSTEYILPYSRSKETCKTGRCTLCKSARVNSDSWVGLSKRLGELLWLQIGSNLGQHILEKRRVYEEQDAILATLAHPNYESKVPQMVEIWKEKIENISYQKSTGSLNIDLLLD